ncbi:hypothetical protein ACOMHN_042669 [Nucella lapillus]
MLGLLWRSLKIICKAKVEDLLKTEEERLKKNGIECGEKLLKKHTVHSLRLKQQNADKALICMIKYLQNNLKDGFMWTSLGTAFDKAGKKFSNQANICFKQAAIISGKFPTFIKEWSFIGPFVIGKTEFDGDPVEAFGGIGNMSQYRYDDAMTYPTELVPNGKVKGRKVIQQKNQAVKIAPDVDWNDLVRSLGSLGITEWQGWAVGEVAINHDELTVLAQCLGVATVFIDGIPVTGDLYHRDHFYFSVRLTRGLHLVAVKLRAKVQAGFQCSFKTPPKDGFEVLEPTFQPDLWDGFLFSQYLSIPVANHRSDKWLKIIKVSIADQRSGESLRAEVINNQFPIAPGQTRPIIVKLSSENPRITKTCENVLFTVVIKTSEGTETLVLTLRCRKKMESFLFTFLDHDRSVQHAAAIAPIGGCGDDECPTLLSLHGTTVPPQNQADSYKRMVDGEYQFGVRGMWLLAPTRHGAHNWEGPGALTAMTALERLASLTLGHAWIDHAADSQHVLFEGHSMGGHGAWHLATHFPDRAIGLAALAGWIKKEEYGDSNLFFKHDIATSHTDASVKAIMEACIGENDADRHISNLWKLPVLFRIGANDRTVHPFFTRRMYRLLREEGSQVTLTELEGLEHWWWDTWETNDGGVVNDKQMRTFAADCLSSAHASQTKSTPGGEEGACTKDSTSCGQEEKGVWGRRSETGGAELVTHNPALGEGLRGVRVLQQTVPFRASKIKINITDNNAYLTTTNVRRFSLTEPPNRPVHWQQKRISIDGQAELSGEVLKSRTVKFCKTSGRWSVCTDDVHSEQQRGHLTQGPARRIAEQQFVIVVGTQGKQAATERLQAYAVYVANLFYLTSDTTAPVVKDTDITEQHLENTNVILIGGPAQNLFAARFLHKIPVKVNDQAIQLGDCSFSEGRMGILTLAPNGATYLAMVLMGTTLDGLADVISLATPTIPPMARSPFSNLLPDFVVTGKGYGRRGPGGFLCAGFWGNQWELRQDLISCACAAS